MIKTISLTANQETAVKIEGGSYCSIENRGTSVVYASKFPNVVASEDNVIAIDSASAKILENATKLSDSGVMQGTIYLVTDSDGAVEVRTAMTTDPFKVRQKGGGESSGGGVTDTYPQSVIDAKLAKKADEEVVNQALNNKVDKDGNKVLSDNNFSNDEKEKLASLENYDDTQVKTDIINLQTSKANADEVYTIAQTNSAIATEVAKIVAEAPESLDTLKEISTWIEAHEDSASAMNLQIQTNKTNISKKVDKKDGYSLVSDTEITRLAEVKNYDDTQVKNDIALNTSSIGLNRKNLLKNTTGTKTESGVLFTVNADGSVTAKRTETSESNSYYLINKISLKKGKYIFSGGNSDDRNIPYILIYTYKADNTYIGAISGNTVFEVTDETMQYGFNINYPLGNTEAVTFYPMLRYAEVTDDTYEPYQDDLHTQINKHDNDIAVNLSSIGMSKKNLLKNTGTSKTSSGITFTVNDDFSISTSGTATANTYFTINTKFNLKGNFILSGCPSGGGNDYRLEAKNVNNSVYKYDIGKEILFNNNDLTMTIAIYVALGVNMDGKTFYPMIRYADVSDSTYEPYTPSLQEQINDILARLTAGGL